MTVRMQVFHRTHPLGPGWVWACPDITTHGSRNGDDWPDWLPPYVTAARAADVARRHWRNWHGPMCRRCNTRTVHRIDIPVGGVYSDIPAGSYIYTCDCGKTVMAGAA